MALTWPRLPQLCIVTIMKHEGENVQIWSFKRVKCEGEITFIDDIMSAILYTHVLPDWKKHDKSHSQETCQEKNFST